MPISLHARWILRAISPRFAIRIFLNMSDRLLFHSINHEEGLPKFNSLTVLPQNLGDSARLVGLDFVQNLHCLDDAYRFALFHGAADLNKRLGTRAGRQIEGTDHGR